jgi:hypothetical protein
MDRVWKPEADAWPKCGLRMGSVAPYELTGLDRWNMESYFSLMDSVDGVVVQVRNRVVQDSEVHMPAKGEKGKGKDTMSFQIFVAAGVLCARIMLV